MNKDNDLVFDPNEAVTPHGMEHITPVARQPRVPDAATKPATAPRPQQVQNPQTQPAQQQRVPHRPQQHAPAPQPIRAPVAPPVAQTPVRQAIANMGRAPVQPVVPEYKGVDPTNITAPVPQVESELIQPILGQDIPPTQELDERFEPVWLPSSFAVYDWKTIHVRRFTINELRAVIRARVSGSLRHLLTSVAQTISRPIHELTVGDFWYIMYWHRINSYKKTPFIISWTCEDKDHLRKVTEGFDEPDTDVVNEDGSHPIKHTMMPAATLKNVLTINNSNLKTNEINVERYNAVVAEIQTEYPDIVVTPQRMPDLVEDLEQSENLNILRSQQETQEATAVEQADVAMFIQAARISALVEDEERAFMHRYAAVLDRVCGNSLKDRSEFLDEKEPDLLTFLEKFMDAADHGVEESWTVKCNGCGASRTIAQSLDALSFLPSLQG